MRDEFQEIFSTLKKNKLRTTLTGLSVSWGIFILIVLLGAGNGLKNGVMENFQERAVNRISLWSGNTSMPFRGLKSDRNLQFADKELDVIKHDVKESRLVTPQGSNTQTIANGSEYGSYQIRGVMPDYLGIEKLQIKPEDGRFINRLDINNENKIIVIDKKIEETLFQGKRALGKYVKVGQLMFKVVGINTKKQGWGGPSSYIPFSTYQLIFNPSKKFSQITFTVEGLETKAENEVFNENLRKEVAQSMSFSADDKQALYVNNSQEDYVETQKIFGGITMFVGIIGIFTLIAGIVGVSNIMLAAAATEVAADGPQMSVFKNPTVNLGIVIISTLILIVSGVIAGYMPAYKAVKVRPIEAMRKD